MKIRKLEVVGFKSFVDRTTLHFDQDVTGIVGPNGCGKSNVVDAIKWVLGEQSAQRLRGKAMDDVIFNGAEDRGPHGFAEVTLTFDNTDGLAPIEYRDYAEIAVTRRLDRQGRSDYFINKTAVRLMDITNLFLGTGVGRRAYSIIEQGRIGYIVSSKPEDRRSMIEEAAGVTKFRVRRKAAERKMDHTRQNLLRVNDILSVLERDLGSLKRQAQKAERYKRYREEIRDLELWVASHRFLELHHESNVAAAALRAQLEAVEEQRAGLAVREAEIESERAAAEELASKVDKAQTRAYEIDNRVQILHGQIEQHLQGLRSLEESEKIYERELGELELQRNELETEREALAAALQEHEDAQMKADRVRQDEEGELERRRQAVLESERAVHNAQSRLSEAQTRIARAETVLAAHERRRQADRDRLEKLRSELQLLAERRVELEQERAELRARLEGLKGGRDQSAARRQELEAELETLRGQVQESDREVTRLKESTTQKRSRLRSLEQILERFEGVGAGVRALMRSFAASPEARREKGVVGLVADLIDCPEELTQALAGALGAELESVVVEGQSAGLAALSFLREGSRGRAAILPREPRRVVGRTIEPPSSPDVVGCLADLVSFDARVGSLARHLLGQFYVVRTLHAALRLPTHGELRWVTLDGAVLEPDGRIRGGSQDDAAAHTLEVHREIRELKIVVEDLERDLAAATTKHGELRTAIAERKAALEVARSDAHDAEIAVVRLDNDLRAADQEEARNEERKATLEQESETIVEALERGQEEEEQARFEIDAAKESGEAASSESTAAMAILATRRERVEEQAGLVTEARVRAAEAKQQAEGNRAAVERLDRSTAELTERERRLRGDVEKGAVQQGKLIANVMLAREELQERVHEAMEAHEEVGRARVLYDAAREKLGLVEVQLKSLRSEIDAASTTLNELTLKDRELTIALEHLLEQIDERHRVDLRMVLGDFHDRALPDGSVHARVDELSRLIERMGEINLMAIEEYEEKSQRFETLSAQKKDLDDALIKLERAIRQMNRESQRLFKEAFEKINARFKSVFPELFRGGKAELQLTDPGDGLESGIDIIAQPPGKRLGALELMSGGEKALTAVALIFSIFQFRPSPFCLLDEVDAPLDEANIARFAESIRQMTDRSQFIVITHSKRTMEFADVLYGVTMEQPGISKVVAVELRGRKQASGGDETREAAVA